MSTFSPDEILRCVSIVIALSIYGSTRPRFIIEKIVPTIASENMVIARNVRSFKKDHLNNLLSVTGETRSMSHIVIELMHPLYIKCLLTLNHTEQMTLIKTYNEHCK